MRRLRRSRPVLAARRRLVDAHTMLFNWRRWREIAAAEPGGGQRPLVFYGHDRIPGLDERSHGGMVKFQRLAALLPNEPRAFNLLYLGSSSLPRDARRLILLARRRGAPVVWNQNGVAYPGWHGRGWESVNVRLRHGYLHADHVFHQSEFCRISAERFLGRRSGPSEVLFNPVDTEAFVPAERRPERPPTLLVGGTQYQRYRLEVALDTAAELVRRGLECRLLVTGSLNWMPNEVACRADAEGMIAARGLGGRVELLGRYTQLEAPEIMRRADVLLHTKYNDPCPGLVLEAMAAGLPVVHSASGGVPELIGADAGVGVPAPLDWERDHPPRPGDLADATEEALARLDELGAAARRRAVAGFDTRTWIARHQEVFGELLAD